MENLQKHTFKLFGNTFHLLGIKDGEKIYLQEPTRDCSRYWSFGYLETFTNNKTPELSKDINSHSHLGKYPKLYEKKLFDLKVFDEKQARELEQITNDIYDLKELAETLNRGGSNISNIKPLADFYKKLNTFGILENNLIDEINKIQLPQLFAKFIAIITEQDETELRTKFFNIIK